MDYFNTLRARKGFAQQLYTGALAIVILGVIVSVGAKIVKQVRDTETYVDNTTNVPYAVANSSLDALGDYGDWFSIIVIVVIATVIIALIMGISRVAGST